ncbi:MAG: molybdopterin-guanine dinucleotide biosynthesis protein B [SAR202 cluster bacterium]|nr:molybdopterin-guanine dinucleotide biosynthesis protein B [SAR202 cluster bacterium]
MPPVIAVVGFSDSGKTRVATALVKNLSAQGYRVGAVKHCHAGHDMDRPGSDTHRLYSAGAQVVVASSPGKLSRVEQVQGDASLEAITAALGDGLDIVIAEGFKGSSVPKVLVSGEGGPPEVSNVIAVVSHRPASSNTPAYNFSQLDDLAQQIWSQFLSKGDSSPAVSLQVNGVPVPLRAYPASVLQGMLQGFIASLHGVPDEPWRISLTVDLAGSPLSGGKAGYL